MKVGQLDEVVDVCNMLGDPKRARIVASLAKGPKWVGGLSKELRIPQPNTSHHLALLRMSGLVRRQRKGKQMIYSLEKQRLTPVKKFLAQLK